MPKKLFLWGLARLSDQEAPSLGRPSGTSQTLPGWSEFCSMLQSAQESLPSNVGYLPVIPASPTELSTILERKRAIARTLEQDDIIAVFDQAIYTKVIDIVWEHPQQFVMVVLKDGCIPHCLHFPGRAWTSVWRCWLAGCHGRIKSCRQQCS